MAEESDVVEGRRLATLDTIQPADFIAMCPSQQGILACCTYKLDSDTGEKSGSVKLLKVTPSAATPDEADCSTVFAADCGAVFDAKWVKHRDDTAFLTVTASGTCDIWKYTDGSSPGLAKQSSQPLGDDRDASGVYIDTWLDKTTGAHKLAVCRSDGKIQRGLYADEGITFSEPWLGHCYPGNVPAEVWVVAFDNASDGNVLWSGGDDATLKCWDERTCPTKSCWINRSHTAGVCSVAFHPVDLHIAATGSYDQSLRIWDTRSMKAPVAEHETDGGVWRIQWYRQRGQDHLAVANMYAGAKLYSFNDGHIRPVAKYVGHESMVYGIEVDSSSLQTEYLRIVTCSFYDHTVHYWRMPHP